jgi:hypothetical protein
MLNGADVELLERVERGDNVFRPGRQQQPGQEAFEGLVARLLGLRDRGLVRLPESRVSRGARGYLVLGPCELTPEGRVALEQDRRLGPRPPSAIEEQ